MALRLWIRSLRSTANRFSLECSNIHVDLKFRVRTQRTYSPCRYLLGNGTRSTVHSCTQSCSAQTEDRWIELEESWKGKGLEGCLDASNLTATLYFVYVWRHVRVLFFFFFTCWCLGIIWDSLICQAIIPQSETSQDGKVSSISKSQSRKTSENNSVLLIWFSLSFKLVYALTHKQITAFSLWKKNDGCWFSLIHFKLAFLHWGRNKLLFTLS